MKVLKLALIGTAALAAVSVTARADDLADLKAQIEALNGRISQLESAPAVPAGYQLMSVSKSDAIVVPSLDIDKGFKQTNVTTIGILPTADVPASTNIQWSGYARAALFSARVKESYSWLNQPAGTYLDAHNFTTKNTSIAARGQLKVVGTTDTAVGEVGAQIQLRGNWNTVSGGDPSVIMNEAWGWWKMTPELTLGGGYTGSLSNIGYGYDGACNCYYTDNAPVALNPGDTAQMRLSYASGPMSFAIALEDSVSGARTDLGVAGELKYSGDSYSGEISGGYWNHAPGRKSEYQLGVGAGFNIGDMAKLSLAAGLGRTPYGNFSAYDRGQAKFWKASALASANLSDSVHAEIAYGYAHWTGLINTHQAVLGTKANTHAVLAGIYYDPVSQLTIGLEGEWFRTRFSGSIATQSYSSKVTTSSVDLVTVFRF
jgi:hypothetical protein